MQTVSNELSPFTLVGAKKLFNNVETMLGPRSRFMRCVWISLWYGVTPTFIVAIFIAICYDYQPPTFSNGEPFPEWSKVFGWVIASLSIIPIPIFGLIEIYRKRGHFIDVSFSLLLQNTFTE